MKLFFHSTCSFENDRKGNIENMYRFFITVCVWALFLFSSSFADGFDLQYSRSWQLKHHSIILAPQRNFVSFDIQKTNRIQPSNKMNMVYSIASVATISIFDLIALTEVSNYYARQGKQRPKFYNMETFIGWNEVLTIPGLLIVWGFRQLPGCDDRIWWYSSILALSGVEDIFFQWLEPLYPRNLYKKNDKTPYGYGLKDVEWLNTWEQPFIFFQAKVLYDDTVPSKAIYQSGFLGFVICYIF